MKISRADLLFGELPARGRFDGRPADRDWRGRCAGGSSKSSSSTSSSNQTAVDTTNIGLENINAPVALGGGDAIDAREFIDARQETTNIIDARQDNRQTIDNSIDNSKEEFIAIDARSTTTTTTDARSYTDIDNSKEEFIAIDARQDNRQTIDARTDHSVDNSIRQRITNITDGGAVEAIRDVAGAGLVLARDISDSMLDAEAAARADVLAFAGETIDTVLNQNQQAIVEGVLTAQQPDTAAIRDMVKSISFALAAALAYAVVMR